MGKKNNNKIVLLVCNNCRGMTDRLLPEIYFRFADEIKIMPVSCPSYTDSFAAIKLLRNGAGGVIIACPQSACCCPENKGVIKKREIMKEILPVFGFHKEQFQLASVSPLHSRELIEIIENMLAFINFSNYKAGQWGFSDVDNSFII